MDAGYKNNALARKTLCEKSVCYIYKTRLRRGLRKTRRNETRSRKRRCWRGAFIRWGNLRPHQHRPVRQLRRIRNLRRQYGSSSLHRRHRQFLRLRRLKNIITSVSFDMSANASSDSYSHNFNWLEFWVCFFIAMSCGTIDFILPFGALMSESVGCGSFS